MLNPKMCANEKCSSYGVPVSCRTKYCTDCSDILQGMVRCECGEPKSPTFNYCGMCRAEINAQETAENEATKN